MEITNQTPNDRRRSADSPDDRNDPVNDILLNRKPEPFPSLSNPGENPLRSRRSSVVILTNYLQECLNYVS